MGQKARTVKRWLVLPATNCVVLLWALLGGQAGVAQTFTVNFAGHTGPDCVKDKFGVYQTPFMGTASNASLTSVAPLPPLTSMAPFLAEAGVQDLRYEMGWGKPDTFAYDQIAGNSNSPTIDFSQLDPFLQMLQTNGVRPLFAIGYDPLPLENCTGWQCWKDVPNNLSVWQSIVQRYAWHYSSSLGFKGIYYEIWNEPDLPGDGGKVFFNGDQSDYGNVYTYSVAGIIDVASDALVGGPAIAYDTSYLTESGILNQRINFASIHTYANAPSQLSAMEAALGSNNVPIFLTEYSSYTTFGLTATNSRYQAAAAFFEDVKMLLNYTNVPKVYWAQWVDDGVGMITYTLHRKALFNAYKLYQTMLPVGRNAVTPDSSAGVNTLAAFGNGNAGVVLWNDNTNLANVTVNLTNLPSSSGTMQLWRIDAQDASYIDDPSAENLAVNSQWAYTGSATTWTGTIPGQSVIFLGTQPFPPAAPQGLSAVSGDAQVTLSWQPAAGAISYLVKRAVGGTSDFVVVGQCSGTQFVDVGLINGVTYYYEVSALNSVAQSTNSNPLSAKPLLASRPVIARGVRPGVLPEHFLMRSWTKQQGLPDNSVTAVVQTRDGYLWVGTSGGLARFDGIRFMPCAPAADRTNGLLLVDALCEDSSGRLWVGTQGDGLLCYSDGNLLPFHAETNQLDNTINCIAEDSTGNLWLGTPSGLVRLGKNRLMRFTAKDGLPNDFVSNVHVTRSGTVWITTRGGMCQFKNGQITPIPFETDSPGRNPESLGVYEDRIGNLWAFGDTYLVNLTENKHLNHFGGGNNPFSLRIWSLCEGRHGELWIGTSSSKSLFRFADNKFSPITLPDGGLSGEVRALCEDREGNLWLGTYGGGLVRLQPQNLCLLDTTFGLPNRPVVCLGLDPQGNAWVGFDRGGLYFGSTERFDRLMGEAAVDLQNLISSMAFAPDGSMWVGTLSSGVYCVANQRAIHFGTAEGLSDNQVLSVAVDNAGAVWVGTASGGLNRIATGGSTNYGTAAGLTGRPITAILPSSHNSIWLGCNDGTVMRGEAGKFKIVFKPTVFGGRAIRALHEDIAGRLWVGTTGSQLACVEAGRCLSLDLNLAPADDAIWGILSDENGDVWISTSRAIYQLSSSAIKSALADRAPIRCRLAYKADSVFAAATSYGWPSTLKSPDGKLWFGTAAGVVVMEHQPRMIDPAKLPVLIENVVANGMTRLCSSAKMLGDATNGAVATMPLPSDLRSLEIQFTALNLSEPENIRFRHRLEGYDGGWVDGGNERRVSYGHLNWGNYTFQVQAGINNNWNENGAMLRFSIPTPLWRTNWAGAFFILVTVALAAWMARRVSNRRLRQRLATLAQQQSMERERMRIAQDMHDEIGSKLTRISYISERAKGDLQGQEPVAGRINSIAETSRELLQSLDEIVWAVNPHNDTLEQLVAYLAQYTAEYLQNTAVECELHIPQELPHHPLSAEARHNLFLAFEEALNNALKHGHPSRIHVEMLASPDQFEIKVEDNGCGFDIEAIGSAKRDQAAAIDKRRGNGLHNLKQRLADLGGKCNIRSQLGHGTTVSLTLPLVGART